MSQLSGCYTVGYVHTLCIECCCIWETRYFSLEAKKKHNLCRRETDVNRTLFWRKTIWLRTLFRRWLSVKAVYVYSYASRRYPDKTYDDKTYYVKTATTKIHWTKPTCDKTATTKPPRQNRHVKLHVNLIAIVLDSFPLLLLMTSMVATTMSLLLSIVQYLYILFITNMS